MNFDRYVYPGSDVLMNKLDIKDQMRLSEYERNMSSKRMHEIRHDGITGCFDIDHIRSIHKKLFGDVYDWAGEFREVQTYKGGTEFADPKDIKDRLERLCRNIKDHNYFLDIPKPDTAHALADVMAELNNIHPFREGNGRFQRLFLEQLALNAGYHLDFKNISENKMRSASIMAGRGNNNMMYYLFEDNIFEIEFEPVVFNKFDTNKKKSFVSKLFDMFKKNDPGTGSISKGEDHAGLDL